MQAGRTSAQAAETASLLESFGIELSAGGLVVMTDFDKAASAYVHHSRVPVAVVAMALASPTFARGRFPKLRLVDVVAKAPSMDGREQRALATLCGASIDGLPEGSGRAPAFAAHLVDVIARHQLEAFFMRDARLSINGIDVRPRGVDHFNYRTDQRDDAAMADWRRAYKVLPPMRQMMVATIITLYRGAPDKTWLARLPSAWHVADAVATLKEGGVLRDWGRLVAQYPGR
jgi:hypothetical protein